MLLRYILIKHIQISNYFSFQLKLTSLKYLFRIEETISLSFDVRTNDEPYEA